MLGAAACSGSDIASPGATNSGGGGGTGGGGSTTALKGPDGVAITQVVDVQANQFSNGGTLSFVSGRAYRLVGRVEVGVDVGAAGSGGTAATLTIEPGVTIFGESGADYIVVNRGSRIIADGGPGITDPTSSSIKPIVFTSRKDLERIAAGTQNSDVAADADSEWGGIVVLGRAKINTCLATGATPGTDACENEIEGVTGTPALYGGSTDGDSSGTLRFVQVRYAGFAPELNAELNGISFGGVGSGTLVDYVQIHNNSDDGVEFFGGTVNASHLVLTGNDDDGFDCDFGYSGRVQFVVIRQTAGRGDKLIECDSGNGASSAAVVNSLPRTNVQMANFTFIGVSPNGAGSTGGLHLREGNGADFFNGVVTGSADCLDIDNADLSLEDPTFTSTLFGCANSFNADSDVDQESTIFVNGANGNVTNAPLTLSGFLPGPYELSRTTTTPSGFATAAYVGAFGPSDTVVSNWAARWTVPGSVFDIPCPAGTTESGTVNGLRRCVLPSRVAGTLTLAPGNIYQISGRTEVGIDVGADGAGASTPSNVGTLVVPAGITLYGAGQGDYMIVNRGSKLFVNGTAANPVLFTSLADLQNPARNEADIDGEWGGMIILGRAKINTCLATGATPGTNACENEIEGVTGTPALYGGDLDTDSSGSLTYMQLRYAGFAPELNSELNGISFGGVGSGTLVDYVQIHNNSDDGVEFFGGRVNVSHLVLTGNDDDGFDCDFGYTGYVQFVINVQTAGRGDKLMECDSGNGASSAAVVNSLPRTDLQMANFTFIGVSPNGAGSTGGLHLREGNAADFFNGVVTGSADCLDIDNANLSDEDPSFASILFGCANSFNADSDTDQESLFFVNGANGNVTNAALTLGTPSGGGAFSFVNGAFETSAAAATTPAGFATVANYVGAVRNAADRWWAGWSCGLETGSSC